MTSRLCTRCGGDKPLSEFYKQEKGKDGLSSWCKPCVCAVRKTRYPSIRDATRERNRRFREQNPNSWVAGQLNRKAKKRDLPGRVTKEELETKWIEREGKCQLLGPGCLGKASEWDHAIPVTRFGSSGAIWNLLPACRPCNAQKSALTLAEWRRECSWRALDVDTGYIHPSAVLGSPPEAREWRLGDPVFEPILGMGVRISAAVTIDCGAQRPTRVGDRTFCMAKSHVGHDVVIGKDCELAPLVVLGGFSCLGDGVKIGMSAIVLPYRHVGEDAVVGAGAVVTRDVPSGTTVVGNPARVLSNWERNSTPFSERR